VGFTQRLRHELNTAAIVPSTQTLAPDLPANLPARLLIGSADTFRCGMKSPI